MTSLGASAIGFTLFGFYTCLFVPTRWATRAQRSEKMNSPVMFASTALYLTTLLLNGMNLLSFYGVAFPTGVFDNGAWNMLHTFRYAALHLSLFIANIFLSWRLALVWMWDYRVMVIPALVIIDQLSTSLAIVILDLVSADVPGSTASRYHTADTIATYLSLGLTLYNTSLVTLRLWQTNRQLKGSEDDSVIGRRTPYVSALVESGFVYTLWLTALSFSSKDSSAHLFFMNNVPAIAGIAVILIQVQRSFGCPQSRDMPVSLQHIDTRSSNDEKAVGTSWV